jgi:hypothetical protein
MPYSITTTSGAPVATVQDATINTTSTALTLIGRDYAGYGAFLNENFIHLLENFSANTAPSQKLTGQIWYDTSVNTLKVWNTGLNKWKPISSSLAQDVEPLGAVSSLGDLWFDTTNNQLHAYNGGWQLIGPPSTTSAGGTSGAIVETILDSSSNDHVVVKLYIENTVVGIFSSSSAFTPQTSINGYSIIYPGFNLAGTTAVASAQLTGDASNALKLNGVGSNQFLRADQPASTPYSLGVGNLVVSTALVLNQITSTTEVAVQSLLNGYNLNFYSNIGTLTRAIGISGADASVTVDNDLSVTGTLGVTGATTLSGTTTLVDITTLQNKIVPSADGTIDIGASATKFAAVYATTFNGSLNGNVTASAVTVGNVAIGVNSITLSGNTMATQAFVSGYVQTAGQNSQGAKTVSTSAPSGTATVGDIWYQI